MSCVGWCHLSVTAKDNIYSSKALIDEKDR